MFIIIMFSHCSIDVKKEVLFNSYCTPLYCSYLWTDYRKTSFSKIRVAFNNVYRRIFGLSNRSSASAMYANYNICNFETKHLKFHTTIRKLYKLDYSSTDAVLAYEI